MSSSFQLTRPVAPVKGEIETAELYGKRIATITLQLGAGRAAKG